MTFRNLYSLFIFSYSLGSHALAQSPTVGNGSVIAPAAGQLGNYGINGITSNKTEPAYSTRHYRRGNHAGIGGSFLQTTSPTSESSPAIRATIANTSAQAQTTTRIQAPHLEPTFSEVNISPALESAPSSSTLRSTALGNPISSPPSFSNSSLDILPSFNKQPSLLNKMQFGTFGSSDKLGF